MKANCGDAYKVKIKILTHDKSQMFTKRTCFCWKPTLEKYPMDTQEKRWVRLMPWLKRDLFWSDFSAHVLAPLRICSISLTWKDKALVWRFPVSCSHIFCVRRAVLRVEFTASCLVNLSTILQALVSRDFLPKGDSSNVLIFSRPVIAPSLQPA